MARLRAILLIAAIALTASGCGKKAPSSPKESLKISINVWPGYAYAFLAEEKGFFKKNNVNVELVLKKSTPESLALYKEGEVDGCFDILADVVLINAQRIPSKAVLAVDYSLDGDVIVAKPEIKSVHGLAGKRISFEGVNTFSHYFVLKTLEKEGISEIDVKFEDIDAHDVVGALDSGKIDAGHTWEPTKTQALKKGYKVLAKAGDIPGVIIDVLVFSKEAIEKRPNEIRAVIKALFEAKMYINENPDESIKIMAKSIGIGENEMRSGLSGIKMLGLEENYSLFTSTASADSLYKICDRIIYFYLNRGYFSYMPDINEIIDQDFVRELKKK